MSAQPVTPPLITCACGFEYVEAETPRGECQNCLLPGPTLAAELAARRKANEADPAWQKLMVELALQETMEAWQRDRRDAWWDEALNRR